MFVSINNYLVPLAGVAWGMAIFGDSLSDWVWAALVPMIAGAMLMNARQWHAGLASKA